ncbi:hypothetical protein IFM89_007006 [Coptis chinensis]|uniref:Uncharacterized protein n=1 Tax=Coptis chinensis TaxID=261450 RepID=A0A835IKG5_9MAGN|nr:hypothetical protein IFM89_007006 [Coptis chinensis]
MAPMHLTILIAVQLWIYMLYGIEILIEKAKVVGALCEMQTKVEKEMDDAEVIVWWWCRTGPSVSLAGGGSVKMKRIESQCYVLTVITALRPLNLDKLLLGGVAYVGNPVNRRPNSLTTKKSIA